MKIKICLDGSTFLKKPTATDAAKISKRIAACEYSCDLNELTSYVGKDGQSWTPATFYNNERKNIKFKSQQLFALDFDNGVSYEEILKRAEDYHIPIAFIYETLSSVNGNKFSVVFLHCCEVNDVRLANYIQTALMTIFRECDKSCSDVARMYYGGKNILYFNNDLFNIHFDLNEITISCIKFMADTYGIKHYKSKVRNFCIGTDIMLINGFPYIKVLDVEDLIKDYRDMGAFPIEKNSIIIGNAPQSPTYHYEIYFKDKKKSTNYSDDEIKTGRRELIRNFNWNELYNTCRLYKEFNEGTRWLYHNELLGIATNLIQIKGGNKNFLEILKSHQNADYPPYKEKNWSFYLNYFEKQNYNAMNCNRFCPYSGSCEHFKNMIHGNKVKKHEIIKRKKENYVSIEEAQEDLVSCFLNAQDAKDDCIHLIKAQTGLGKSHTYLDYLENNDKFYIIALPTNKLKDEIFEKAKSLGYHVCATPELPDSLPENIKNKLEYYYSVGAHKLAMKLIKKLAKKEKVEELKDYLECLNEAYEFNGHLITTHARLLTFPKSKLENYDIIIDEDIIRNLMQNQIVKEDDLKKVLEVGNLMGEIKDRISEALYNTENNYFKKVRPLRIVFLEKEINEIVGKKISSNVIDFLKASVIYKCGNEINFLIKRTLPKQKIIIMSATADEEIYYKYFGKDRIKVYNCKKAKYKGRLLQYPKKSCSRASLQEDLELVNKINILTKGINVITFKKLKYLFKNSCGLHFGNTEGHNCFEGTNIAVVGTPHLNEYVYMMYATALGLNVNGETLSYQQIEYGNYKFWFMTYKNSFLRRIQLWLIQSELEQSVGRARLLRNDCNVLLFSNFPLEQADFCRYSN